MKQLGSKTNRHSDADKTKLPSKPSPLHLITSTYVLSTTFFLFVLLLVLVHSSIVRLSLLFSPFSFSSSVSLSPPLSALFLVSCIHSSSHLLPPFSRLLWFFLRPSSHLRGLLLLFRLLRLTLLTFSSSHSSFHLIFFDLHLLVFFLLSPFYSFLFRPLFCLFFNHKPSFFLPVSIDFRQYEWKF